MIPLANPAPSMLMCRDLRPCPIGERVSTWSLSVAPCTPQIPDQSLDVVHSVDVEQPQAVGVPSWGVKYRAAFAIGACSFCRRGTRFPTLFSSSLMSSRATRYRRGTPAASPETLACRVALSADHRGPETAAERGAHGATATWSCAPLCDASMQSTRASARSGRCSSRRFLAPAYQSFSATSERNNRHQKRFYLLTIPSVRGKVAGMEVVNGN